MMENNLDSPDDKQYIMITSPRLVNFEITCVKFAIELLEYYAFDQIYGIFKTNTTDEDERKLKELIINPDGNDH